MRHLYGSPSAAYEMRVDLLFVGSPRRQGFQIFYASSLALIALFLMHDPVPLQKLFADLHFTRVVVELPFESYLHNEHYYFGKVKSTWHIIYVLR